MKKTSKVFIILPFVLFALQLALGLPKVREFLGLTDVWAQLAAGSLLFLVFVVNQQITFIRPFRRFLVFERTKEKTLARHVDDLNSAFSDYGLTFRVNVMLVERKSYSRLEPKDGNPQKRKISFYQKHLIPVWNSRNMDHDSDNGLIMTVNQGICGLAYKKYTVYLSPNAPNDLNSFNLNGQQLDRVKFVKFVLSIPIRDVDHHSGRLKGKIIGVLTIDSKQEMAWGLLNGNTKLLVQLIEKGKSLSEICSDLY